MSQNLQSQGPVGHAPARSLPIPLSLSLVSSWGGQLADTIFAHSLPDFDFMLSVRLRPPLSLFLPHLKEEPSLGGGWTPPVALKAAGLACPSCLSCPVKYRSYLEKEVVSFWSHRDLTVNSPFAFNVLAGCRDGLAQSESGCPDLQQAHQVNARTPSTCLW